MMEKPSNVSKTNHENVKASKRLYNVNLKIHTKRHCKGQGG